MPALIALLISSRPTPRASSRCASRCPHTARPCCFFCHPDRRLCSTVLGVSGEDYAIIASDTRLSEGYSIHTRDQPKAYKL